VGFRAKGDGVTGKVLRRRAVQRHDKRLASRVYDTTYRPADDQLSLLGPMRGMQKERKRKAQKFISLFHNTFLASILGRKQTDSLQMITTCDVLSN